MIDAVAVFKTAETYAPKFAEAVALIDYERKGVLFSEMLFLLACCSLVPVNRIIESGRARGQSTHVLATIFPEKQIISIEFDPHSRDRAVAEERLRGFDNLELLFGDSTVLLPRLIRPNDAVMIDGPKHYRALRLGLHLLRKGKPSLVFFHDVPQGAPERRFLGKNIPDAVYSDDTAFIERFRFLDERCWQKDFREEEPWRPFIFGAGDHKSYGPTFGCVSGSVARAWSALSAQLTLATLKAKLRRREYSIS